MPDYQPVYDRSYALVMGIDDYRILPQLSAAVRGAQDLAEFLQHQLSFETTLLTNADVTRDSIFEWLTATRHAAGPDDRVVVYFAGHGMTRGDAKFERGYFALSESIPDKWHTAVPMDDIIDEARYLKAKHLLYLLDCCFSGLALESRAVTDIPRELEYYISRSVRYAISAGGKELVDDSLGPDGCYSLFTYHLLDWLKRQRGVPASGIWRARELGNYLEEAVARDRRSGHKPNHNYLPGSGDGDFIFYWDVSARFSPEVSAGLRSAFVPMRLGAVVELINLANGDDPDLAALAVTELDRIRKEDPDRQVRATALSFFDEADARQAMEQAQQAVDKARQSRQIVPPARPERPAEPAPIAFEIAEAPVEAAMPPVEVAATEAEAHVEITIPPVEVEAEEVVAPPRPAASPAAPARVQALFARRNLRLALIGLGGVVILGVAIGLGALILDGHPPPPTSTPAAQQTAPAAQDPSAAARQLNDQGKALYDSGDLDKSLEAYNQAIQLDPKSAAAYYNRGVTYAHQDKLDLALADFNQAIQLDPKEVHAYEYLGYVHKQQGKLDLALADFDQAIQLDPKDAYAYMMQGRIYRDQGKLDEAIARYNQAIQCDAGYIDAYRYRGRVYNDQGKLDEALADYNQVIQLDPRDAATYRNRGGVYRDQGKTDKALADFTKSIELDPKNAWTYIARGNVYHNQGKEDEALADYKQAAQLEPGSSAPLLGQGNVYFAQGKLSEALAAYNQAIQIDPKDELSFSARAAVYYRQGKMDEALADYNQVIRLDPGYATAYYYRGIIYDKRSETAKAIADYTQYLKLAGKEDSTTVYARERIVALGGTLP